MFVVAKLGGCNGSGKTTIANALIALTGAEPYDSTAHKRDFAYRGIDPASGLPVIILASYENVCGGMDTISDKDDRLALVKAWCKPGHIVFYEGLITGKTYGAMGALSEEHVRAKGKAHGSWLYAFLDTPFETCVDRTMQRRTAAAKAKGKPVAPLDPERTLRPTFDSCQHLLEKLRGTRKAKVGPQPHPHPTFVLRHKKSGMVNAKALLSACVDLYRAG